MPVYQRYTTVSIKEESRHHTRTQCLVVRVCGARRIAWQCATAFLLTPRTDRSRRTKGVSSPRSLAPPSPSLNFHACACAWVCVCGGVLGAGAFQTQSWFLLQSWGERFGAACARAFSCHGLWVSLGPGYTVARLARGARSTRFLVPACLLRLAPRPPVPSPGRNYVPPNPISR